MCTFRIFFAAKCDPGDCFGIMQIAAYFMCLVLLGVFHRYIIFFINVLARRQHGVLHSTTYRF